MARPPAAGDLPPGPGFPRESRRIPGSAAGAFIISELKARKQYFVDIVDFLCYTMSTM